MSSALLVTFFFLLIVPLVTSQNAPRFSLINKDESSGLYTMTIYMKTPLQPSKLHLDLGSFLPWYDCARHHKSSTYQPVIYNSSLSVDLDTKAYGNCFEKPSPGCSNDTCSFFPENPVSQKIATGLLLTDKYALPIAKKQFQLGKVSEIVLSCTGPNKYSRIYRGLAKGSTGLASLGRFNYSLSAQISRASSPLSPWIFALCLPTSSKAPGIALFNSPGPYNFSPGIDLSRSLTYTPLILDYYIGLTSFRVNKRDVSLDPTLLAIAENGMGGTKLGSSAPYSVLQTSIFTALKDAFVKESVGYNLTEVKPVAPFSLCYAADTTLSTRLGPAVPTIDLVLQNTEVVWRIYGSNSMVNILSNGVDILCLGFVDGGQKTRTSIVIGGHQMKDNLLQLDLERKRLGFSSSLLLQSTNCANFNV
ncbi:basic 7S globulin 2-like [Dorcoceras hygrometricum]|uniref:Basic 7S globulin 2-like n=1 Tax=Dorcoceras hygrometricum TaxID=472368 RepID=A0A2Z7CEK3_9LAMI|nr:basic 7S globulin 2-like [Dorcoceras hygrometricum]